MNPYLDGRRYRLGTKQGATKRNKGLEAILVLVEQKNSRRANKRSEILKVKLSSGESIKKPTVTTKEIKEN